MIRFFGLLAVLAMMLCGVYRIFVVINKKIKKEKKKKGKAKTALDRIGDIGAILDICFLVFVGYLFCSQKGPFEAFFSEAEYEIVESKKIQVDAYDCYKKRLSEIKKSDEFKARRDICNKVFADGNRVATNSKEYISDLTACKTYAYKIIKDALDEGLKCLPEYKSQVNW